jgi:homoserine dehydrogenase
MLYGKGVGIDSTSSLVLRDLVSLSDLIFNKKHREDYRLNWRKKPVLPMEEINSSYYVRLPCVDKPGVIGQMAGIFGKHGINIGSAHAEVEQELGPDLGFVHTFVDHAKEMNVMKALNQIQKLDIMRDKIKFFRIYS